ncbi:hypothetical protein [Emticicia sp. SJ17W-69]
MNIKNISKKKAPYIFLLENCGAKNLEYLQNIDGYFGYNPLG